MNCIAKQGINNTIDTSGNKTSVNKIEDLKSDVKVYPNPFTSNINLSYTVTSSGIVEINLYDSMGQLVRRVINNQQEIGDYNLTIDGSDLSKGLYFLNITNGTSVISKKLIKF
ncbi:MAG: T9SS type A sorting domain-containing protein [Bacteroidetes bacterium]|nr:T9SS type A sorting domain-containing protein [Bacteroidota bacterium]